VVVLRVVSEHVREVLLLEAQHTQTGTAQSRGTD
jgi:hypothetical protein